MLEFIKKDLAFWKAEAEHNATVHTCCVLNSEDECVYKCVLPRKQDVFIASFLGLFMMLGSVPVLYLLIYCGLWTRKKFLPQTNPENSD